MKISIIHNINSLNPAARLSSLAAQNPKIMKNTLKKLEDLQSSVEELVEKRQDVFDNRSEKWQESENGEKHQEITDKFTEILDQVTDWISDLESFQWILKNSCLGLAARALILTIYNHSK